jgi:hypothetical protein
MPLFLSAREIKNPTTMRLTGLTEVKIQGWFPSSSSYRESYQPVLCLRLEVAGKKTRERTDSEPVPVDGSAQIYSQPGIDRLIYY